MTEISNRPRVEAFNVKTDSWDIFRCESNVTANELFDKLELNLDSENTHYERIELYEE